MDGEQGWDADSLHKKFTHAVTGTLWRDHRNIGERRRHNLAEMNIEPVSKHQCLTRTEMGFNGRLVHSLLSFVGNENHDHVGGLRCLFN